MQKKFLFVLLSFLTWISILPVSGKAEAVLFQEQWNTIPADSNRMMRISAADGIIHIQNPTFKPLHISIYTLTGRLVNNKILNHNHWYYFARKQYLLLKINEDIYKIIT